MKSRIHHQKDGKLRNKYRHRAQDDLPCAGTHGSTETHNLKKPYMGWTAQVNEYLNQSQTLARSDSESDSAKFLNPSFVLKVVL